MVAIKNGIPAWVLALIYLPICFLFPGPLQSIAGLLFALILFLSATTAGRLISRLFSNENRTVDFPLGLGSILLIVYAIGFWNASPWMIHIVWGVLVVLSLKSVKQLNSRLPFYSLWGLPFFAIAVWSSFTPTTFYDAVAYNLGIPFQSLATQKIGVVRTWTTSYFPPFDHITKFLLISVAPQNAIKIFSFVLYVHALRLLNSVKNQEIESKFIIIPLLLLPVPWILLHIVNPDLLNSFFFVAGVCAVLSARETRGVLLAAVFVAFTCWTKYTIYPYLVFFPVLLWRPGMRGRRFAKSLILFASLFLLLMSPLYISNFIQKKDPLYPVGSALFPSDWTEKQTAAVQKEFPTPKTWQESAKAVLLTPFRITFGLRSYGSASEIGFLPLIGLLLILFQYKKLKTPLTLFVALCYLMWISQLYHFRYFLPVYLVAFLFLAYSFQLIGNSFPRGVWLLWSAAIVWGLVVSGSVYQLFPLIKRTEKPAEYLSKRLSYFDVAQFLNRLAPDQFTIMVGETRNAYFRVPLIPFSYTDPDPLLKWAKEVRTADELYRRLKSENVGYILFNPAEMKRLSDQYGIWRASAEDNQKVNQMLGSHGKMLFSKNGVHVIRIE